MKILNLYYVNNYFSKLLVRDVSMENGCFSEKGAKDIWVFECSHYKGPLALFDVQEILFHRHQEGFQISINATAGKIDLQCWRLEICQHNQDRLMFFPSIDAHGLSIFNQKQTLRKK